MEGSNEHGIVVALLDEHVVEGKRLGRHVEHDPRSRNYAEGEVEAAALSSVAWQRLGGPFNQGQLGSCTGNAMAGALNTGPFQPGEPKVFVEADAVAIYEAATKIDNITGSYPPDDTGSSGLAVCKVAKSKGYIHGYGHAFGINAALAALQKGPVITGIPWYEGFDTPNAEGMVEIAGQIRGGHEIEVPTLELDGEDLLSSIVEPWNSWGLTWGIGGRFRMTARTWAQLLEQQGDVTVPHR